jgi:hypothetical protein
VRNEPKWAIRKGTGSRRVSNFPAGLDTCGCDAERTQMALENRLGFAPIDGRK